MTPADWIGLRFYQPGYAVVKKSTVAGYIKIVLLSLLAVPANAQVLNQFVEEPCNGPVFGARDISQPATITARPIPEMTQEARDHDVHGRVVVEAILCRTGRVTDLRIVEGLPYGMTEKTLEAVRQIKFTPAEMNWHTVSQKIRLEFYFNERGVDEIAAKDAEGRTVEAVEIIGNRRVPTNEILRLIQTQPGTLCSVEQLKKDLAAILATGHFNSRGTRISPEEGSRGGVVVVIEVQELPVISQLKFEGLTGVAESSVFEAWQNEKIDLRQSQTYDPAKVRTAIAIIRKVLAANGQRDVEVEERSEGTTADSFVLTFVIRRK